MIDEFRALHTGSVLVLPNAWDVASARLIERAGAKAVATTSAGVAWSLGAPDGDQLTRDRAVDLVARVVAGARVPVTADIESGFGATAAEVGDTVRAVADAGAAGVNIEDGVYPGLRDLAEQTERIAAARAAAALFVNARIDTYLFGVGEEAGRLAETVARARAYLDAGADGVFVPGVADPEIIAALVSQIPAPLNVLVGPGSPPVAELAGLGVARVSAGSSIALAAYSLATRCAEEMLTGGTYHAQAADLAFGEVNALLA
ncbi:MAG: isocitrate lyase/phosphoenolpyruvate mutase family protein [Actinophytocola sp.]|uniref:isocitrate lyase/PEP mutase family protein n=1 Tax=Actinophytocola sp. TaxID=1872138 RepID=UPI00132BC48C|nr:isocitrate lyase/phosphoenolpyruvate mutase family protein [Actinophytocola sp.]MPZ79316.1 isocitrate lyase/phosphoenolpyruvate mutase family protein [Actinophytocola sp.]